MADYRDLVVRIKGDTKDFESSLGKVKRSSDDGKLSFGKLAGAVATGNAIFAIAKTGVEKLAGGLNSAVKSANESEDAMTQLKTVLDSTGAVSGQTVQSLEIMATALQRQTKYSDEAIMGAESLLLTFTNIKGVIFNDALPTILDMSQALGQDLKSSTIQLGKALNDPIKGITALTRVGVSFTEQQKDQIKQLVAQGKTMEAQKVILKELNTEFGGSAIAAGKTFSGSIERLKNQFDDLKEKIGGVMVEALTPLGQKLADVLTQIDWEAVITLTVNKLKEFWAWIILVKDEVVKIAQQAGEYLEPKLKALWNTIETQLAPTIKRLYNEVLKPLAPFIGVVLLAAVGALIDILNAYNKVHLTIINLVLDTPKAFERAFKVIAEKFNWLKDNFWNILGTILGFLATLPIKMPLYFALGVAGAVKAVLSVDWGKVFAGIWWAMQAVWDRVTQMAVNAWHAIQNINWGDALMAIGRGFVNAVNSLIEGAINGALSGIPGAPKVHLPRFATGTDYAPGGWAIVGERGAELVNLPRGSQVKTAEETKQILGSANSGGHTEIHIHQNIGMYAGMPTEKREIALNLWKEIVRSARAQGVSLPNIGAITVQ